MNNNEQQKRVEQETETFLGRAVVETTTIKRGNHKIIIEKLANGKERKSEKIGGIRI